MRKRKKRREVEGQEQEEERRHDQPERRNRKEQKVKLRRAVALNSGMFSMKRRGLSLPFPGCDASPMQVI